jgi:hypothetical protein
VSFKIHFDILKIPEATKKRVQEEMIQGLRDFGQDFPDSDTRTRLGIAQALARRAGQTRNLGRTGHGKGAARAKLDLTRVRFFASALVLRNGRVRRQEASQAALSLLHARGGGRLIGSPAFRRL